MVGQGYARSDLTRQSCGALARGPSLRRPRDSKLLHLVNESRPPETQTSCRSSGAPHNPVAFAERSHDLPSLGLFQRVATTSCAGIRVTKEFTQRYSQRGTFR